MRVSQIGAFEVNPDNGKGAWSPELAEIWGIPGNFTGDFAAYCWEHVYPDDLARVNLAARLSDGLRVYVPAVGETATPVVGGATDPAEQGPINLNEATADQLDDLPGIGPATATAIVAYRRDHGPFSSIEQLLDVRGIGPSKLEQIRSMVVV